MSMRRRRHQSQSEIRDGEAVHLASMHVYSSNHFKSNYRVIGIHLFINERHTQERVTSSLIIDHSSLLILYTTR